MGNVITLALKDLRLLLRDRLGLFWVLIWPLVFGLLFGAIFAGGGEQHRAAALPVAIIDEDATEVSREFISRLESSSALKIEKLSLDEAKDEVRKGDLVAYVVIRKGYADSAGFFWGEAPALEIGIDPSRQVEGGYLQGILMQEAMKGLQERFADPEEMRPHVARALKEIETSGDIKEDQRTAILRFFRSLDEFLADVDTDAYDKAPRWEPVRIETVSIEGEQKRPLSSFEISFPAAILWGVLGCAAGFGISIVSERVGGTFLRLRIAPLRRAQILGGKGLACFVACQAVITMLLLVGRVALGVRIQNPAGLLLAMFATGVCFVGLMILTSVLGKTEQSVAGATWGILCVMAMLGGGMIPLIAMPEWMRTVSHVSPVKWSILSLEGAIWRDFRLAEMALPCAMLIGFGALMLTVGLLIFRRQEG